MSKKTQNKIEYEQIEKNMRSDYSQVILLNTFIKVPQKDYVADYVFCDVYVNLGYKVKAYSNDISKFICKDDIDKIKNFETGETIEFGC